MHVPIRRCRNCHTGVTSDTGRPRRCQPPKSRCSIGIVAAPLDGVVGVAADGHTLRTHLAIGWVALVLQVKTKTRRGELDALRLQFQGGPLVELFRPEVITSVDALSFVDASCRRPVVLALLETIKEAVLASSVDRAEVPIRYSPMGTSLLVCVSTSCGDHPDHHGEQVADPVFQQPERELALLDSHVPAKD